MKSKNISIEELIDSVAGDIDQYNYPFRYCDEGQISDDLFSEDPDNKLPEVPERKLLESQIRNNKSFIKFVDDCIEMIADGIQNGIDGEKERRVEEAEYEKEQAKKEAERQKQLAQQDKLNTKKTKAKQMLAKSLNSQQKKALQEIGLTL